MVFHSDRGSQYTAFSFRQLLDSLNVVQSFSKKGYPFDNACCECFFKYLKKEETNRRTYHSLQELQLSVFEYIEEYYNSRRPHGSLGMLTPNEKEELFWNQAFLINLSVISVSFSNGTYSLNVPPTFSSSLLIFRALLLIFYQYCLLFGTLLL